MKRIHACTAVAVALIALLGSACGGGAANDTGEKGGSGPRAGGTLVVAVPALPTGYPILQAGGLADNIVGRFLTEGLTRYAKDSLTTVEPALATKWQPNADATEWTFTLRDGVTWQDGQPFTAEDVKFTFDLVTNPDIGARSAGQVSGLERVDVVDDHVVKMVFSEPAPFLPTMLAYNMGILPKHIMEGLDPTKPTKYLDHPIGTGAFEFVSAEAGSTWTMKANPDWWGGKVLLDQLVFRVVPDPNSLIALLASGEVNVALVQTQQASALEKNPRVKISAVPQVNYFYVSLMNNKAPFDDAQVRQALNYAVDKKALIDTVLKGFGDVATTPIPPALEAFHDDDVPAYEYDPAKAKQMLAAEGWSDTDGDGYLDKGGKTFEIELTTSKGVLNGVQLAEIIGQQFKDVGIKTTINPVEFAQLWTGLFKGEFQATVEYLVAPPSPDLYNDLSCEGNRNRFFYCNPEADKLMKAARSTTDRKEQVKLYDQFQQAVHESPPGVYLYYPQEVRAFSANVKGFPELPLREAFFYIDDVWLAK